MGILASEKVNADLNWSGNSTVGRGFRKSEGGINRFSDLRNSCRSEYLTPGRESPHRGEDGQAPWRMILVSNPANTKFGRSEVEGLVAFGGDCERKIFLVCEG